MKKAKLSEIFSNSSLKCRVIALAMAIALLAFTGCSPQNTDSKVDSSSQPSQSESLPSNEPSDVSSGESSSSKKTTTSINSSAIKAEDVSVNYKYVFRPSVKRTDATEVPIVRNPANLYPKYKSPSDEAANALREEILKTKNTLEYYKPTGKIYYVSPSGNDTNDGLSPEKAVKSLAGIEILPLEKGDAVLLERNSIFRMTKSLDMKEGVIYGSYGEGEKPILLGSAMNFAQGNWQPSQKRNVWKMKYMYNEPVGGFFNQGEEWGTLKVAIRDLEKNTDFCYDNENSYVYLYCDKGNPALVYSSIEFTQSDVCVLLSPGVDDVVIDNLAIRYTGNGGISGVFNNHNLTVTNCEIGFTGGAWQTTGGVKGLRSGNGIGLWCGGKNFITEHNWVYQTFDSGISPQGNADTFNYDNNSISYNLFEFNNADIEFFNTNKDTHKNDVYFNNLKMDNNIMRYTSLGWGTRVDDGGIRGIEGVLGGQLHAPNPSKNVNTGTYLRSSSFSNNIIDTPGRVIIRFSVRDKRSFDEWTRTGNVLYFNPSSSIRSDSVLVRGIDNYKLEGDAVSSYYGNTLDEVTAAFRVFDPTAKIYMIEN